MQDTPFRGRTAAALLAIAFSLSLPVQAKSLPPGEEPTDIVPVADPGASTVPRPI